MIAKYQKAFLAALAILAVGGSQAKASYFTPGDLLVSSSTYAGDSNTIAIGQMLPVPGAVPGGTNDAIANGQYFTVFNNDTPDANFGVTAPITISQLTTGGVDTGLDIQVPTNVAVTSFSSKSELALNLSSDGNSITFMGYNSGINQIDISNADTPGVSGGGSTATPTARVIAQLNSDGSWTNSAGTSNTLVNTYSGNNGRAAILANGNYYTVGNSGATATNAYNTGAQIVTPGGTAGSNSTSLGTFIYPGDKTTKIGKDNNFRGEVVYNNTLYVTKGSGSNGADTVYQVGASGTLPTGTNNTISILPGFDTNSAKSTTAALYHPFGLWFANATTLYVGDEGDGVLANITNGTGYNQYAGLEKWSLNSGTWHLDYILTNGLNIGQSYTVSGTNGGVSGNYTTATDGLRDITGVTNSDGTVSIYAITSTASTMDGINNSVDEGTDPNKLLAISDVLADTNSAQVSTEAFTNLQTAAYGQVLRGVSFTPQAVPEPSTWALLALSGIAGLFLMRRKQQQS